MRKTWEIVINDGEHTHWHKVTCHNLMQDRDDPKIIYADGVKIEFQCQQINVVLVEGE